MVTEIDKSNRFNLNTMEHRTCHFITKQQILLLLVVAALVIVFVPNWYTNNWTSIVGYDKQQYVRMSRPFCDIPYLNPRHRSLEYLTKRKKTLACRPAANKVNLVLQGRDPKEPSLLFVTDRKNQSGEDVKCFYYSLVHDGDNRYSWTKKVKIIKKKVILSDEFIHVMCLDNYQTCVYDEFYAFIQNKTTDSSRRFKGKDTTGQDTDGRMKMSENKLNALILVIDSVSRSHFIRQMKRTYYYLKKYTTRVDMKAFNRIAVNTFETFLPMLIGRSWSDLQKAYDLSSNSTLDDLPFIWKEFSKEGYKSLFAEDRGTLEPKTKGFATQPTDYYFTPFVKSYQKATNAKRVRLDCIGSQNAARVILNWVKDFFDVFSQEPLFGIVKLSAYSHDSLTTLYVYDIPILRFFQYLNKHNHLNRTVVFFLSDHGFRFGNIRHSYFGRMEANLPFLFILYPYWFKTKYTKLVNNLKANSRRLTTVYDIHATLKNILNFEKISEPENGQVSHTDLFHDIIPFNRVCKDANIPFQFCACDSKEVISVTTDHVQKSAKKLVKLVNSFTNEYRNVCHLLELDEVLSASSQHLYMDVNKIPSNAYHITVQLSPGGGIFEGAVVHLHDTDRYTPDPTVERINKYGNQSVCVDDATIKQFCYCRVCQKDSVICNV